MKKAKISLADLLSVVSPSMVVRIMDSETSAEASPDPDDITVFRGTAISAFHECAGKLVYVKHISPEVEKIDSRYVLNIYVY